MNKLSSLAAVAALSLAAPASAATLLLTGTTTTNGTSLLYVNGTGANQVRVSATALSYTGGSTPAVSSAVKYGNGLGVNPSGDDRHTVDNSGAFDFILLRFDRAVILNGATFTNDNWYNDASADTDATISWYSANFGALGQTYATDLGNLTARNAFFGAAGGALTANAFDSLSTAAGTQTRSFNTGAGAIASNVWVIGASVTNADRRIDSFKLKTFTYELAPPVPEPATWAMLILGMGALGGAMRQRRRAALATA